jgi:hypothetical protein
VAPLEDPDRLSAYKDALANWRFDGFIEFELTEMAFLWVRNELGIPLKDLSRLMHEFVDCGGEIDEVREKRPEWQDEFEYHYDLRFSIENKPVYWETRLIYRPPFKPDQSVILVVNIHDP